MKMTKKVLSILLSLMLVLGAVAVGGMSSSATEGSIVIETADIYFGETEKATVTVPAEAADFSVTLSVSKGENWETVDGLPSVIVSAEEFEIPCLNAGIYKLEAETADGFYSGEKEFEVKKATPDVEFTISNKNPDVMSLVRFSLSVSGNFDGSVTDETYSGCFLIYNLSEDKTIFSLPRQDTVFSAELEASLFKRVTRIKGGYTGDSNHEPCFYNKILVVKDSDANFRVSADDICELENGTITVAADSGRMGETVEIIIRNAEDTVVFSGNAVFEDSSNGKAYAYCKADKLPAGEYYAEAGTGSDKDYVAFSVSEALQISDYAGLKAFASRVNDGETGLCAKLMKDIDASASDENDDWTPIGNNSKQYTGTFDGLGNKITGLTFNNPQQDYAGLFGCVGAGGVVQNVGLEGGSITGKQDVGGVAGTNYGTVTGCYNTGDVSGSGYVGGVVGYNLGTTSNCYNTSDVSGSSSVGGVVGEHNGGTITYCYNTGVVSGSFDVGGVVGYSHKASVLNCYNTGNVIGQSNVGGVIGEGYTDCITSYCYNTGNVFGDNDIGGVAGYLQDDCILSYSYNTGSVKNKTEYNDKVIDGIGGVIGKNHSKVLYCYNTGDVSLTVSGNIGGVAGANIGTVTNCYNTGNVTSAAGSVIGGMQVYVHIGGVAGFNIFTNSISNCYYDRTAVTIQGASADNNWKALDDTTADTVTGLTTAQMTGESALENMVFTYEAGEENPWLTKANNENSSYYPHLKGFAYDTDPTDANWPPKIVNVIDYPLWVGGNQVTSDNMDSLNELDGIAVTDGGSVKFVPDADGTGGTLYLNNATITGTQSYKSGGTHDSNILVENKEFNITINLEGENTLGPAERGIWMVNNSASSGLALTGDGKLSITAEKNGIVINCDLLIDGADINVTATGGDSGGTGIIAGNIDIRNSSVYAEGTGDQYGIFCASALTISDSSVESGCTGTYGRGLYFSDEENFTVSGDSFVTLEGGTRYGALWIKGSLITENGNEIVEPANYIIDPLETGSDVYLVYDVTADEKIPAVNVIITNPLTITVTANPTGGGTITGGGKTYKGADVTLTAAPETGYDFVSWTEGTSVASTNAKYSFTVEQSRNLVANFKLQVKSVSVSANLPDGGTVSGAGTYNYGENATVTALSKDHYSFVNWTENGAEVSTNANYSFPVTGDRNLVANFAKDKHTVEFVNDDGAGLQSGQVPYGETPAYTGETPTKEPTAQYTYSFAGWSPEITSVSGDVTYTAVYASNPVDYKLTWTVDGESYKNETIPFGGNITLPDVEAKEGYTFAWVDEIPATMPAEDVTVNGQFTAIEYTAKFVNENGETVAEIPYTVENEKIEAPAVPVKEGYNGEWEEYELTPGGITVKPVYTPADTIYTPADICPLDNEYHGTSFWGRLVKFFHTVIWKAFRLVKINVFFKIS